MSWWSGKVRRFARYFTGRITAAERADLATWLAPAQLKLFESMHAADQRHGLDVVAALRVATRAQGGDDVEPVALIRGVHRLE